jgi:hypothetical protein
MKSDTACADKKTPDMEDDARKLAGESTALDRRYGRIGISAVAAAALYQGIAKNAAYAPATNHWHDRSGDTAA